ncbi:hypothetical protein [Acidobacterium sp. S8]|uniref:hypothetical protein n=1 Tax=Acidobacterium sp. S8 TaxID=1641854 RepID=UPI00131CF4CD|nr:hypothetical protein [Acidobacterium sp. S8]
MNKKYFLAIILGALALPLPEAKSQKTEQVPPNPTDKHSPTSNKPQPHEDEGQRLFEAHCSRCHTAPEGFSPNISGTVVRHMRVRASLSQHDEQELLRFFNP